jgi:hydroxyacylglutathione hydrolase
MKIEQIYTGCLAQGAYYITSNGEAAIIDPLREVQPYMDRLQKRWCEIKIHVLKHISMLISYQDI